jgi:hypothetical protein
MSPLLLDAIAIVIVLLCAAYALRTLLPGAVLERIGGRKIAAKKSADCGGCGGCSTDSNKDSGCH